MFLLVFAPHKTMRKKMRNISLQNNVTNSFHIKFYTGLQSVFNSTLAALLTDRLEFWFGNKKYKRGFYKFVEPCANPLYRKGDSWSEELGVSRKCFNKAFDIIGIRYKSKSAYLRAEDKFQGKLYVSYHDRKTNRTYYIRNHEFTSKFLDRLFKKKTFPTLVEEKENLKKIKKRVPCNAHHKTDYKNLSDSSQSCSWNGNLGRSSYNIQKKTSPSLRSTNQNVLTNSLEMDIRDKDFTEGMIKIWNEEIGELGISTITKGLSTRLNNIFKTCFGNSLKAWHEYCQMIASSKFLMGEAQNKHFKKAWITWSIKPETIESIKGGAYKLGDRQTNKDKATEKINHEIYILKIKKRNIEEFITSTISSLIEKRKKTVKEKIKNFSEEEHKIFQNEFIQILEIESSPLTNEFKRAGWNGLFVECAYLGFLEEKIETQLFKTSDEVNKSLALQSSDHLKSLKDIDSDLNSLEQKKREVESKSRKPLINHKPRTMPERL
jgi:hypothetical protein